MAQPREISLTGALAKLKRLDDRIEKAQHAEMITYAIGGKVISDANHAANLQSAKDLIDQRQKLKVAIKKANAETQVVIKGEEMTIDEAIERKHNIIYLKTLLDNMKSQLRCTQHTVEDINRELDKTINDTYNHAVSSSKKLDESSLRVIRDQIISKQSAEIVDNANLAKNISELESIIDEFELNVDIALSETNSKTIITL